MQKWSGSFYRQGYTLQPLLTSDEIDSLLALHHSMIAEITSDYFVSSFSRNLEAKRQIRQAIQAAFAPKLRKIIPNYRILNGIFVTKRPHSRSGKLGLHHDYSLVDHSQHAGIYVWCPLSDVDVHNGCMHIVAGSHTFAEVISAVPPNPTPYKQILQILHKDFLKPLPMRAGTAMVFDGRLLHASGENQTSDYRVATLCPMVPAAVAPLFYRWNPPHPNDIDVFEVNEDFYIEFEPNTYVAAPEKLGAKFLKKLDYTFQFLQPNDLARLQQLQAELFVKN
jgi:ectoine hydroxylase-related dioxygenase (phytanoyl-CoA dioxygenase family)